MLAFRASAARGLAWLAPLLVLPLLQACKKQNAFVPPPPAKVEVARPVAREVTPYLELTGTAQAVNQVDLVARVQGFVQSIEYRDGAVARRGDTLFALESAPYEAKLRQARAGEASAEAQLTQAQAEFGRQSSLSQNDFSSRAAVDVARAARDMAVANLANQQAAVAQAAISLGYTRVAAPFEGQVTAHQVSPGALVGVTGPTVLATLVQLDPIRVICTIGEQDVLRIKETLPKRAVEPDDIANVAVEVGRMNEAGYPWRGKMDYAAPALDAATGTLTIRGILPNPERAILPGMFLRVRIPLARQTARALLVPDSALGADQAGRYLLIVDKDDVVRQRAVRTGPLDGGLRTIVSGLDAEDRVVVRGLQKASPGAKVVPEDVAMSGGSGP